MHYKQLISRTTYEETRLTLSEGYREISDGIVEACYTLTRYKLEKRHQRSLSDNEFKDIVEFASRHQSYAKTLPQGHSYDYNTIVEHMLKHGYYVPSLIIDDVKSAQQRETKIKDFFTSRLSVYPHTQNGFNDMYKEYHTWYRENFPQEKSTTARDFKEILRQQLRLF